MRAKWKLSKIPPGREYDPVERKRSPDRDESHLAFIRSLPCAVLAHSPPGSVKCAFRIHAHHPTGAGMALKAPDEDAIPLCLKCHESLHRFENYFAGWSRERRRDWERIMSATYRALGELRRAG